MWKCTKCDREFKNTNQDHFCGEPSKTIDAYIAAQPENVRPIINQIRDKLRETLPDAKERISWGCRLIGTSIILSISRHIKSI